MGILDVSDLRWFESPSVVDIHRDARGKCTRRGVHCCRGRGGGGM
jgi:hypothetical protein